MQITSEHIAEYLDLVREYKYTASSYGDKVQEIESYVKKTTTVLTGMPGGGGSSTDDKLADYVFKIETARAEWDKWSKASENVKKRIQYFIFDMPISDKEKTILYRRYVCLDSKDSLFKRLNKTETITYRWMEELHKKALETIADYINDTGKYKEEIEGNVYGQNRTFIESLRDSEGQS